MQLALAGGPGSRNAASPRCRRRDGPAKGGHQPTERRRTLVVARDSWVLLRTTAPATRTAELKGEVRSAGGFVEPGTAQGRGRTGCSSHLGSPCPSLLRCISPTPPPVPELFRAALLRRRAAAVLQGGSPTERLPGPGRGRRGGLSTPPAPVRTGVRHGPELSPRGAALRAGARARARWDARSSRGSN